MTVAMEIPPKTMPKPLNGTQLALPFISLGTIVNVSTVPQLSPFRYPGGKTWLVPHVRRWLASLKEKPKQLIEPFAGGGIVGLTAAFEALAESVLLAEIDAKVAAVWQTILSENAATLAERILTFQMTTKSARELLDARHRKREDIAFATLVRNRVQHGGIMSPGASLMKEGENGKGVASRWYAATLANRIRDIAAHADKISFVRKDAFKVIRQNARAADVAFFVDPPYTIAGRRLYAHSDIDHPRLFAWMAKVQGDFLMTYDDTEEVRAWASKHKFDTATVAMKSRQHTAKRELLIGRNLDWTRR